MKRYLLVILTVVQAFTAFAQTTLRVDVPNVVAADEQFNATFIIEGDDNPTEFSWNPGSDFKLVWGPQTGRSTSTSIVNGQRTRSSQYTYTYVLMPVRAGTYTLPAATAKFKGGKELTSKAVSIEVVSGRTSSSSSSAGGAAAGSSSSSSAGRASQSGTVADEDLYMNLTLSRTNVVIGEPIEATLKLYQRVNIAGFEDAQFPTFNGFWSQEVEAPTNIEFKRENVNGVIYNTAVLRKYVLIPQQTGSITIDPAELVCLVNVRVASSGVSIFDAFFDDQRTIRKRISSKTCRVNVSALPAGAPASFGGGVGKFTITASLSKDSLMTHEAASLVVTVKGRGNVSLLEAPKVSFPPDMEVYDAKVSERIDKGTGGTSGSKVYEFPFIPRSHGDFEIPPISYSYYDVSTGKYVTLTTPALAYHVDKGKDAGSVGGGALVGAERSGVRNLAQDIRFIHVKVPQLKSKGDFFVFSPMFIVIMLLLLIVAVVMWLMLRRMAVRKADVAGMKTRRANKVALRRLKTAGDYLQQNLYTAFYEELHKALIGYVSDKLNMSMADLSKEAVAGKLLEGGVAQEVVDGFISILDACEFARYSPDAGNAVMTGHYEQAISVISSIESGMKVGKSGGSGANGRGGAGAAMAVTLLLMLFPAVGHSAENEYVDSLWNGAVAAYTDGRWSDALNGYERIASLGLESPELYCNIGDSYFKTGDFPHAILYYEKALKLDPSYSDARYNLDICSNLIQDRIDPVPEFILSSWAKSICYSLSSNAWAVLCIAFFAIFLAMLLLYLLGAGRGARRTGFFVGIVMFCLTCASLGFSAWQKADYHKADSAIVTRPVTSVKSSPSDESSTDLFILHEGTKVEILDEVGGWINISLADGRQGWMLSADIEVI